VVGAPSRTMTLEDRCYMGQSFRPLVSNNEFNANEQRR
jgi:hypothetical protein